MHSPPPILRLGTRGSLLARTQSQLVADLLAPHLPAGTRIELVTITTSGDKQQDRPLQDSGGKGLFVKELDEAILDHRVDFTVHSAKDLPAERPPGLLIAATPKREDPRDVWIGRDGLSIDQLPTGATVGTASLRRRTQLLARRPDLHIIPLRGNIDTRLRKVAEGFDNIAGTFLAAAGLNRTHLLPPAATLLPVEDFIPAAGQGTLAIEARATDALLVELLQKIHDPVTAATLAFERAVVASLAGSCLAPIGVCALPRTLSQLEEKAGAQQEPGWESASRSGSTRWGTAGPGWIVRAIVGSPDGKESARAALMARNGEAPALHTLLPDLLLTLERRGARDILGRLPSL